MDETTLKRATEPFFTTKGAGRGTGLGLSMVDGLVAQSGGAMRITSQTGVGTRIELWLPVCAEAPVERAPVPVPVPIEEVRACRVLVVDDDPIVASGTAAMLEDLGHIATEVSSGDAALQLLGSEPAVDLVITDHAMPGMTGTELAAYIRRRWPELPIVIATGYAEIPGESDLGIAAPVEALPPAGTGRNGGAADRRAGTTGAAPPRCSSAASPPCPPQTERRGAVGAPGRIRLIALAIPTARGLPCRQIINRRINRLDHQGAKTCPTKSLTRRAILKTAALTPPAIAAGSLAAPFVHGAYAAGTLSMGTWDHWVPGASQVLEKICQDWAAKEKVELKIDLITSNGDKDLLTLMAEGQARVRPRHHGPAHLVRGLAGEKLRAG